MKWLAFSYLAVRLCVHLYQSLHEDDVAGRYVNLFMFVPWLGLASYWVWVQ